MEGPQSQLSFEAVSPIMDSYTPSHPSTAETSPSEGSPLSHSPLSTPETGLEDAPPLNGVGGLGLGLGLHTSTSDPTFVLVIGGLGFIGSHTVLELLRAGYNGESCPLDNDK